MNRFAEVTSLSFSRAFKVWVFPYDRFIEYEKRDELWARPLGFGHEETRTQMIDVPRAICLGYEPASNAMRYRPVDEYGYSREGCDITVTFPERRA